MTASLYQSARSGACSAAGGSTSTAAVSLAPDKTEDMRGQGGRVELDEIAPARPRIAAAAEEIVHLVALARADAERLDGEIDPGRMAMVRAEVRRDEHDVVAARLRVDEDLVVVAGMEAQAPVRMQRRVPLPDLVQLRDQLLQA